MWWKKGIWGDKGDLGDKKGDLGEKKGESGGKMENLALKRVLWGLKEGLCWEKGN